MEKKTTLSIILVIVLTVIIVTIIKVNNSEDNLTQKSSNLNNNNTTGSGILYSDVNGDLNVDPIINYLTAPGTITAFIGTTIPNGWIECNGSELSKSEYSVLYSVIGDTYGTSSNSNNFILPDFRGRVLMTAGSGLDNNGNQGGSTTYSVGNKGGEYYHHLTENEMPSHNHGYTDGSDKSGNPDGAADTDGSAHPRQYWRGTKTSYTTVTGGHAYHNIMQPYIVVKHILFTGKES